MLCFENGKQIITEFPDLLAQTDGQYIGILSLDEFENLNDNDIKLKMMEEFKKNDKLHTKFEHHSDYVTLYMNIPSQLSNENNVTIAGFYLSHNLLLIIYKPWGNSEFFKKLIAQIALKNSSLGETLICLLNIFSKKDALAMQKIEQEIETLEEELIVSYDSKYINKIINLRKELLVLKNYYEQMIDMFDELKDNDNNYLDDLALKHCINVANRVNRLYHTLLNLRDYVTQVRESYQSQADIRLNDIMKVFTVVTSIFLPLTLIAGWYGMNLKMPEYHWIYGYPVVIGVSCLVVIVCFLLFKKNKWF